MSMLAENRKKVKYSTNPRGTRWSNDDDKFGKKLMEKFGWQKGRGLGANEDGRVEHVRASKKNDTKGFGFKKTNNDNWICHQDDFNSLLSELNASHGRTDQENDEKVISLEEKSKAAKKRVHYHKHAKGKDLSQRSSEDLDCIFGRKKSKIPKEEKEVLQNVEETKDVSEENTHGIQTIQSNQSVQEYFAMKLAQMKAKKNVGQQLLANLPQKEEMEQEGPVEVPASEETSLADPKATGSDEEKKDNVDGKKSKKKKKKKSKEKERQAEEEEEDGCYNSPLELVEKENLDSFNSSARNEADDNCGENCDENPFSKKARKSKHKKRSKVILDDVSEAGEITETVMEELPVEGDDKMEAAEINLMTKPKKKKRNKKCKDEISEPDTNAADGEILENSSFCNRDSSNSINAEAADITFDIVTKEMTVPADEETEIVENETATKPKKSKKNKRTKDEVEAVDNTTAEIDILDKYVAFDIDNNSNNASRLADNNDEEAIASPPKKKKKKKSAKKSKSEADEFQDAFTADDSVSDKTKTQAQISGSEEMQELEQSSISAYASWGSLDALNSSLKNSPHQIPENKQEIKRSPDAVGTATKVFQEAGANVDKICGYGYSMQ